MTNYKIETKEAIALMVNLLCNKLFVLAPLYIKNAAGSAIIMVTLLYFIIAYILWNIYVRHYDCSFQLLSKVNNKTVKATIGTIVIVSLAAVAALTLRQYGEGIKVMTLTKAPIYFIVAVFSVAMIIGSYCGIKSICKTSGFFVPIIYIIAVVLVIATIKKNDLFNFFPILGTGFSDVLGASITILSMLFELIIIFFLPPLLKNPQDFRKIGNYTFFWTLVCFITISGVYAISSLGVNTENYEPFFRMIKQIKPGSILQRCDSVFLILYCISAFLYLSAMLFFLTHITSKTFEIKDQKALILPMGLIISSIATINVLEEYIFEIIGNANYFLWIITFLTPIYVLFSCKLRRVK